MSETLTSESMTSEIMTRESLQGWVPELVNESELRAALEQAFDYRGDITITLKSGEEVLGFVYDRKPGKSLADSYARVLTQAEGKRRDIAYANIAALNFSGRDTAAGKTWESWVKKYADKKAAGETNIGLAPEELE